MVSVKIDEKTKKMTIEMDLCEPHLSSSGKTMVIASTEGNIATGVTFKGKPVTLGLNAYYKP